ncbi:MAG TPA: glycosyltransferase [Candidatus Paceibacterota bacterium]|nr:glycosyltransferase [Candidatus Paceibacterota bacterium]
MKPAPIALFAYNRPDHLARTLEALSRNEPASDSHLFVFCDGPRSPSDAKMVQAVRDHVGGITGFKSLQIVQRQENLGLAQSIILGVTLLCNEFGRVIVVEDDLVTSPYFLRYLNEALALYEKDSEVISIHGYVYPVKTSLPDTFFIKGADCWGWATWKRGWDFFNPDGTKLLAELEARKLTREFDFNDTYAYTQMLRDQIAGRNNSWAIRWYASAFLQNKLTLYPGRSLVRNIGLDSSGVHCDSTNSFDVEIANQPVTLQKLPALENAEARRAFTDHLRSLRQKS